MEDILAHIVSIRLRGARPGTIHLMVSVFDESSNPPARRTPRDADVFAHPTGKMLQSACAAHAQGPGRTCVPLLNGFNPPARRTPRDKFNMPLVFE